MMHVRSDQLKLLRADENIVFIGRAVELRVDVRVALVGIVLAAKKDSANAETLHHLSEPLGIARVADPSSRREIRFPVRGQKSPDW